MPAVTPPPSADESYNQQLKERSEESEYETISQDEGLASPTVTPYTVDDDFSFSSLRPLKSSRSQEEPTTSGPTKQLKGTISTPNLGERSQEKVAHEGDSGHCQYEVVADPSAATAARSPIPPTPSIHRGGGNRQDDKDSTPNPSSLSQNTHSSLPNIQQAAMSPHARANLSQEINLPAASDQPQPISSPRGSINHQQQQERSHHYHVHVKIFILQRRAPGAFAMLMHYLLNILKIMFLGSILYFMYTKEMVPLPPFSGREKLYVLKRM